MSRHHSSRSTSSNDNANSGFQLDDILKNVNVGEILKNVDMKQLMSIASSLKSKKEEKRVIVEEPVVKEAENISKTRKEKLLELIDDDDFKNATLNIISKYRSIAGNDLDMNIFDDKEFRSSIYTLLEKILSV